MGAGCGGLDQHTSQLDIAILKGDVFDVPVVNQVVIDLPSRIGQQDEQQSDGNPIPIEKDTCRSHGKPVSITLEGSFGREYQTEGQTIHMDGGASMMDTVLPSQIQGG